MGNNVYRGNKVKGCQVLKMPLLLIS